MMIKTRYNVKYRKKRQTAVESRAYCGLMLSAGGSERPVNVTVFEVRPEGGVL